MRWQGRRQSDNVEDRRGTPATAVAVGGGLGTLVLIILGLLLGVNPNRLLQEQAAMQGARGGAAAAPAELTEEQKRAGELSAVVLADTEDVWTDLLGKEGMTYVKPKMVLFTDRVQSACGMASTAVGPFYCPGDQKVYLDTAFFDELRDKFKAPGDFAQAYVIAHEVGHHVQNLLGTTAKIDRMRGRIPEAEYNQLSVRLELQADFLAGVFANHAQRTKNILENGDIESALRAATAIGDDRLQMQTQGYVVPDSFTHGTSEQRLNWFLKGLKTGDLRQGDTFGAKEL